MSKLAERLLRQGGFWRPPADRSNTDAGLDFIPPDELEFTPVEHAKYMKARVYIETVRRRLDCEKQGS